MVMLAVSSIRNVKIMCDLGFHLKFICFEQQVNNKSFIYFFEENKPLVENDVSCIIVVNKCKLCSDKEQISCGLRMHLANHYRGIMSDIKMDKGRSHN